jgi:hypothetical protein
LTPGLPDPRRYGAGSAGHRFLDLANEDLQRELRDAMLRARDAEIAAALRAAPSREAYARLWDAICAVAQRGPADAAVVARVFALPIVVVTGARGPAGVPGTLPDGAAVAALLAQHGALGTAKNFGVGNALCAVEALEAITPSAVYAWTAAADAVKRELPASAIELAGAGEKVHLRFLVGAAIAPAAEPSIVETASNIGAWGMPLTRLLAVQLAQPGVEVLPLPRPPLDVLRAAHAGRDAQREAAFDLYASSAVRRFRSATGDPGAVIGAHADGEIRVTLNSPFDAASAGFRWPLHPLDDIEQILQSMLNLLAECRVTGVHVEPDILPAAEAQAPAGATHR